MRNAVKTAMEYLFSSLRLAKIKNFENIVGKNMWKQAFRSYTVGGNINWYNLYVNNDQNYKCTYP